MAMIPTSNRILVRQIKEQCTKTGIWLPDTTEKPVKYAEVIQIGPKILDFVIGDVVVFSKYVSAEEYDGCLILKDEDVLAIVEELDTDTENDTLS